MGICASCYERQIDDRRPETRKNNEKIHTRTFKEAEIKRIGQTDNWMAQDSNTN
jgi:hypothetical protein